MYGTKLATVLRQPSGLFLSIRVLLPIHPLLNQLAKAARHVASQEGRNSRGRIPVKAMTPDSVIRALQQSIHVGKEKQSEAKINKGSRCGFDASIFPTQATNRDQSIWSTPLSLTCTDKAPLPRLTFSVNTTMFAKVIPLLLDLTAIIAFAPTPCDSPCPTTLPSTTEWSHESFNVTAYFESAALEGP